MVTFPKNSAHIIGVKLEQSGGFADGTLGTKMERGADKRRVVERRPAHMANVVLLCTDIGRLQVLEFYLDEALQTTRFFNWPCLPKYDDDALMRFEAAPQEREQKVGGLGLWELSFSLEVRRIPAAPSYELVEAVEGVFGSVGEFYIFSGELPADILPPQIAGFGALTTPSE